MKHVKETMLILLFFASFLSAQSTWETVKLGDLTKATGAEVTFIENTPVIDGRLDASLQYLPVRYFCNAAKKKEDKLNNITFRMAYGTNFFYLYIEADADKLIYRDRAYQNGDGFVVTLAKPMPNNEAANEFYDLACSAVNKPQLEWTRRIFWNYNVDKIFVRPSNDTKLEFREGGGKISFELYLPWKDIRPNHPWLKEGIGFNISFCKAVEPEGSAWYQLVDEDLRSLTRRNYTLLKFQEPVITGKAQSYVNFKSGHINENGTVAAQIITVSANEGKDKINFEINRAGETKLDAYSKEIEYKKGITITPVEIPAAVKPNSAYSINYKSELNSTVNESQSLTVMHNYNKEASNALLQKSAGFLKASTITTIQFLINEIDKKLNGLYAYETGVSEFQTLTNTLAYLDSVKAGIDPFRQKTGFIRKAFLSKIDNTLQPYVVYLPSDFDKTKKYPLLVHLHGSESYETSFPNYAIPEGFIGVSPFGRGTSNAFTRDNAQEDIAEAIDTVVKDFNIDESRILLAGFSMGGYGVYRTYFESPKKFRGVASFSGGPSLGKNYSKGLPAPDFMDEKNLAPFKDAQIFIFHGEKDRNVSFAVTREFMGKLKNAGAVVDYAFDTEEGHSAPTKASLEKYKEWVNRIMK